MKFDCNYQPYASNRYPVMARGGMVATGSPLASAAGLDILRKGGNAVDAAIATAAALTVVEPTANGIGGDAFAIVWFKDELYGLNGSGYAPENISIDEVIAKEGKIDAMPTFGWTPITIPGAPKAWAELSKRFGRLSLSECLAPAVNYAREGYPASAGLCRMWKNGLKRYGPLRETSSAFEEWFATFTFDGKPPKAGDLVKLPNHETTLEEIGNTNAESFYRGDLADRIVSSSVKHQGFLRKSDFERYEVSWVKPMKVNYRGYDICEIPPNGQGIVALMALNILKEFQFSSKESVDTYHKQFEAMKIAFRDGMHYVTDTEHMKIDPQSLITPKYGAMRAAEITPEAQLPDVNQPSSSGTVYLCTADDEGNMVSFIQSNYMGFGSGVVIEGTGIAMQNRGHDFSLDPQHSNCLAPLKKTYHTIIPGFIMKDGKAVGPFGVMGGYMQPQGHVQVAMNLIDFNLNPQMALDAPRWQWMKGKKFILEDSFDNAIAKQLVARGHEIEIAPDNVVFGRGQIIVRMENGTLVGGCESRTDSNIACF
ncbi:MAG: gamma-glutamyltransferase family protein [Erysipelotrichales bacterium]|nr:MAG: gamma-glutamyltransferase family protein [Erysipelotrichales bacterium]